MRGAKVEAAATDRRGPADTFTQRWQLCAALWRMGLELEALPPDSLAVKLAPLAVEIVRKELRELGHIFEEG